MKALIVSMIMMSSVGCATAGNLTDSGYTHEKMDFEIAYHDTKAKKFLPTSWSPDQDARGRDRLPKSRTLVKQVKDPKGRQLRIQYKPLNLLFQHRATGGVIAVSSHPLNEFESSKNLDLIAKDFTDSLSGRYFASKRFTANRQVGKSSNWVSKILEYEHRTEKGVELYEATIEITNSDQLRFNPQHRDEKAKIVLLRPSLKQAWTENYRRGRDSQLYPFKVPALLVVSYSMDYNYFDQHLGEFDQFLKQLQLIEKANDALAL